MEMTSIDHTQHTTRYTFEEQIGKGMYGTVYKAYDNQTDSQVAIKHIQFIDGHCGFLRTVVRELVTIIKLSAMEENSHTVKLLDCFFPNDADPKNVNTIKSIYLVLTYCEVTLDTIIYEHDTLLKRGPALVLAYNLLCAVKFLHSANLMHRDLKPDNILVTKKFEVLICDFGFARSVK